ncbi:MAG: hypothetical protein CVV48_16165 [Spirochaetae bacterium HGW-Spirochaetae-4]|jgi:uncharacterized protein (DUF2147 family)|nr:MAG: hypothetical protein CVV52_10115 [Spirochaetae bacterium HGW-Spirochaetae-8]PKL19805.1 MAG: hypothetical protein CVV48_16165 [Spirochaetae bacterium HGW-Spirochaetae-4]HCS36872.1 hypothetical protein [Sphaerochaeta sp.]
MYRCTPIIVMVVFTSLIFPLPATTSDDVVGFWKSTDAKQGFTTSVIAVYSYGESLYGRVVVSYDERTGELLETMYHPLQRVEKLASKPKLLAIDIFWNMKSNNGKWHGGKVLDPRSGHVYACECWVHNGLLVLRGKIGPFGMNSIFYPVVDSDFPTGFVRPELTGLVPSIPQI